MRLLVAHGYGMSSEIIEQMMGSLMTEVGRHHEWIFVDGEVKVNRSAMADFMPGRHLAYWDAWEAEGLQAAYELLEETIKNEGPFDGAIAYSQGGAWVLGYLLQQLTDFPDKPLPFKFAVFFGTAAALSSNPDYKTEEIMSAMSKVSQKEADELHDGFVSRMGHKDPREFDAVKNGTLQGRDKEIFIGLLDMVQASLGARDFFGIEESDENNEALGRDQYGLANFPRFFNALYTNERINIPTVHIRGLNDDPSPLKLAEIAQELCEPSKVQVIRYNGVHEVPHREEDVVRIRQAIEKAYIQGQIQMFDNVREVRA